MNNKEARSILTESLVEYRSKTYKELQYLLESEEAFEVKADSGKNYYLDFRAVWVSDKGGNIRIIGEIHDGGWRSYLPLTNSFILTPDGKLSGE